MPRKKKKGNDALQLNFTGKMSVLIELEGSGPLQWRIDDMNATKEVANIMLKYLNDDASVDAYTKREQTVYEKILLGI